MFKNKLVLQGFARPILGCDPEFFFSRNGKIIGSEKVLPKGGVIYRHGISVLNANKSGENKVIMDGVQVELNPLPSQCRESLAYNIVSCLSNLSDRLRMQKYQDVKVDFSQLIKLDKDELDSLSGDSKRFGCMPSKNIYGEKPVANNVDPMVYPFRCAGGHIHIGDNGTSPNYLDISKVLKDEERLVRLFDVIVGNTCVLLDRDPGNVERRKVYGRAGEYRTPKYGIEYRTLSNFWLRSYPLMSFVMGLSRLAVNILANGDTHYEVIMSKVNTDDIRKAINENDFELAYKNFRKIEKTLLKMIDGSKIESTFPFSVKTMPAFHYLFKVGIDTFFKKDNVLNNWLTQKWHGWEHFLYYEVTNHMKQNK